ncbi:MAG: right-handed parallel beta-helix repeat-containing protein [Planctomycetota bacterium]
MQRTAAAALAIFASVATAQVGPPPGPVADSGKSIDEAEPRTPINARHTPGDATAAFLITRSGSYYLTGNLVALSSQIGDVGIRVDAPDVTIDLSGFTINGRGVFASAVVAAGDNVALRNGIIKDTAGDAVNISGAASVAQDLRITMAGDEALELGSDARVARCTVAQAVGTGIRAGERADISHCDVRRADDGISAGTASRISDSVAAFCEDDGLRAGGSSLIIRCQAFDNTDLGIVATGPSQVIECVASSNDGFGGISVGAGSHVERCIARSNAGIGISLTNACVVIGCSSGENTGFGYSIGSDNRIEGNHAARNDGGGDRIVGSFNVIVRNAAVVNSVTNYDNAGANNYFTTTSSATSGPADANVSLP